MCNTCGCNITPGNAELANQPIAKALEKNQASGQEGHEKDEKTTAVMVLSNLLAANNHEAAHNRGHFDAHGVLAINLMSSPGSGKTRLLEVTLPLLKEQGIRVLVIEGDLATENDAKRLQNIGFPAIQINTVNACHLDAHMIHEALHQVNLADFDIVFIENVGNLVCPASFDLGQHYNVTLLSVTEGSDKPVKYPVMFKAADLLLITKSDLLAHFDDFSPAAAEENLRHLANDAPVLAISAKETASLLPWLRWLQGVRLTMQARWREQQSRRPWIAGTADASALEALPGHAHSHDHSHEHLHAHSHSHDHSHKHLHDHNHAHHHAHTSLDDSSLKK